MELTDPSIITSSINGELESNSETPINSQNGQENDLQQFIKFLRNKNDSSKAPGETPTVDEFHEQPIETTIESIVNYKPNLSESSKIYVYSINELLDITKTIPKEYIEEKADSLPRKKFWRLYQKFPENSNHKSNYRNNNNNNNPKSRSYSNDTNSTDRKNNNKSKSGKNNNNNKKNSNKSMALTNDELEFDANFESSGNAIADFEAWKSQMKEMERQKKLGIVNHPSSTSSTSLGSGKGNSSLNKNDALKNTSTNPSNTQSSIISDFLNLSRSNASSGPMNAGTILGNNQSAVSTPHESPEAKQLNMNPTANETKEATNTNANQNANAQPAELSRSSSSRFTSFFSNASSSSSSKPLNSETNNDQHAKTQQQPNLPVPKEVPQNRNQATGSSKLMGFFNAPAPVSASQSNGPTNTTSNTNSSPNAQQQQPPLQMHHQQMQMPPQQMGMQPGNNTFFQNLLNKNKANETRNDSNDQQFNQMQIPPPGMGGHPMGHQMVGPPPGMNNNFNNAINDNNKSKNKKDKNGTQNNNNNNNNNMPQMGMPPPHMGMPPMPPHMMQGNFNMPPPGFGGFPGQGPNFPLAPVQRDDNKSDKNVSDKNNKSKNNGPQGPMQQQNFMPMMGPPPPGFMPMGGMPPNMQMPNGMMMPPFPSQQQQQQQQKDGKDVKNIQGGPQPGFFPQQMPPHSNFPMNPNMMPPQNQMRMNNGQNQNKK